MKKYTLSAPLLVTAALAPVIALNLGCGKRNSARSDRWDTPEGGTNMPVFAPTNSQTNANGSPASAAGAVNPEITNPPAAVTTTVAAPATPDIAPTAPADKAEKHTKAAASKHTKVVEMSDTPPVAPEKFYNGEFATNHVSLGHEPDYYVTVRAGYQHAGYGDNSDTWYGGFKFHAYPDNLRTRAGKNAWLIPNLDAELSHQFLARPDRTAARGSAEGMELRADLYWPWLKWSTDALSRENSVCPFTRPMHFTVGPVFATGFEKTFDGSGIRFDRYGGARLTINRSAFIQYAYGKTDGIGHNRQEVLGEVPFYISRDGEVRYVFRGEWSRGDLNLPDYYQLGAFVEMPLDLLVRPREWRDLIPFAN
ncbi:MAG: hypothetical protein P4N60_02685 [Verrucomicrobiae bacterium]|nr:hypothetical protein [Verrucomicrobiae bacterium]